MTNLVFQTAFLGDLLLSIPLLKNLKQLFPEQKLALVCRPGFGAFFLEKKLVDQVFEMDKKNPEALDSTMEELRKMDWNYIVSPHESPRTAVLLRQLCAHRKVGFKRWWNGFFFDQRMAKPYHLPDALRQLSLLTLVDADFKKKFDDLLHARRIENPKDQNEYQWSFGELPEWASMLLESTPVSKEPMVVLAPGSVWNTKRWNLEGYEQLAQQFVQNQYKVVLIGTKQEEKICEQIAMNVPQVENKAGQTSLSELYGLLRKAQVLFCNDSGAMHLAAAAGTPTVSVFGPTVLAQGFMPWNPKAVVAQKPLSCRPCGRHGGRSCPIGTHECMKGVAVEDVLKSYKTLQKRLS